MLQQDCLKKYYALPYCYLRIDQINGESSRCLMVNRPVTQKNGEPRIF